MPSSSEEISMDRGRFSVPLKHICSKKWESPLISLVSYLDPASTNTKTVAAKLLSFGAVIIRRPLSKVIFLKLAISWRFDLRPLTNSAHQRYLSLGLIFKLWWFPLLEVEPRHIGNFNDTGKFSQSSTTGHIALHLKPFPPAWQERERVWFSQR